MPDEQPKPPDPPPSGIWSLGWKVLGMPAEQQRGFLLVAMIIFGGWMMWDDRERGRRSDDERHAATLRLMESTGERVERSNADLARSIAANSKELSQEIGGLKQQVTNANATMLELKQQVQFLGSMVGELKKKLPPSDEINLAPFPKLKGAAPTGPGAG